MKLKCYTPINPVFLILGTSLKILLIGAPLLLITLVIIRKKRGKATKKLIIVTLLTLLMSLLYWSAVIFIRPLGADKINTNTNYPDATMLSVPTGCGGSDIIDYLF